MQLLLGLFLFFVKSDGAEATCNTLLFNLLGSGRRLQGKVIIEHKVRNVIECTFYCSKRQPECQSFNYESRKTSTETHSICQLNNDTKTSDPSGSILAETFDYWEMITDSSATSLVTSPPTTVKSATSCAALYKSGTKTDGVYNIDPDGRGSFAVKCDMTSDGGGWTIIQKKLDGSVDFNTEWINYKAGFGRFNGEFWLGLDKMERLTAIESNTLRIDLKSFAGEYRYATYSPFAVGNGASDYKLTASNYNGNAGDSLARGHNGMKFTTRDKDNDLSGWQNCAIAFKGGWWFNNCHASNLNGFYHNGQYSPSEGDRDGVVWETWKGLQESLKETVMKIRPADF